jgi:hypothetical protein
MRRFLRETSVSAKKESGHIRIKCPQVVIKRPEKRKNVRFYRSYHIYVSFRFNLGFLSTHIYTYHSTISVHNSGIHIYTCQPFALCAFGYPYQTRKSRLATRKTAFILRGPFSSSEIALASSLNNQSARCLSVAIANAR